MGNKVLIFGAGSSVHAGGPLNRDWIKTIKLDEENNKENKEAINFLEKNSNYTDLEALITLIDLSIIMRHDYLSISASLDLNNVRNQLINCIINVVKKVNLETEQKIRHFIKNKLKEGDAVINFNYDLLIDTYLSKTDLWSPYYGNNKEICGYGFGVLYNKPKKEEILKGIIESSIEYIKPHGSINWLMKEDYIDLAWNHDDKKIRFDPKNIFGYTSFNNPGYSFLVAPSFIKSFEHPAPRHLWIRARENIKQAEEIWVIGYSFPKADILSRDLLMSASSELKIIKIIDPLDHKRAKDKAYDVQDMLPWELHNKAEIIINDKCFDESASNDKIKIIVILRKFEDYVRRC